MAFVLVIWVASSIRFWSVLLFPFATTFMLWWYSPVFKKKPLIGNVIVALCTALVPVFAAISDLQMLREELALASHRGSTLYSYAWLWILGIAAFAFVLTMIREVVKDVQDEPGDRTERYQTIPILWGIRRTKRYVIGWMMVFFAMVGFCALRITNGFDMLWLLGCLVLPMLVALFRVYTANAPADFGKVSRWIKLVMLGGLLLMIGVLS